MQQTTINDAQQQSVTAQAQDAAGNASTNFNPVTWVPADPTVCSVTITSGDTLTANIVPLKVGSTTVTVTGTSGSTSGTPFSSTFGVNITTNAASQFVFTFAPPIAKG